MGRPKGSKNKPKVLFDRSAVGSMPMTGEVHVIKQGKRKALGASPLEKLAKAGLTLDDLKALLGQVPPESSPTDSKAELRRQMMTAPISPAEIAKLRKEAMANMAKVKDPQIVVQEAVDQVVKPNWAHTMPDGAGLRHFLVKAIRNGDSVSFDKEKWDLALKQAGIRGVLNTCKPEGSAEIDPQQNQGGGSMNLWRVMIG